MSERYSRRQLFRKAAIEGTKIGIYALGIVGEVETISDTSKRINQPKTGTVKSASIIPSSSAAQEGVFERHHKRYVDPKEKKESERSGLLTLAMTPGVVLVIRDLARWFEQKYPSPEVELNNKTS